MAFSTPELSDDQLITICENANVIACECPAYLVGLLQKVRKFRHYTAECVEQMPEEVEVHNWLSEQALQVEALLTRIIFEFMQREDLLDEQQQLDITKLAQRSHQAALRQLNDFH